jgi:hypothetical protein
MAYPAAGGRCPGTVVVAVFAFLGAAVVGCTFLGWNLIRVFHADSGIGTAGSTAEKLVAALVLMVVLMLIFFSVVLALFDLRGRRGAWIVTLAYCGLMALLSAIPVVVWALVGVENATSMSLVVVEMIVSATMLALYLTAGILLVLPASARFYRKRRRPAWMAQPMR